MFNTKLTNSLVAISIASVLSACGGSGGGTPGTTTSVTSSGTITGFGSVIVNGVRYETTSARVIAEDSGAELAVNPSNAELQNILGVGNVVKVRGTRNDDSNGVASTITIDNELVGTISDISDADGTFVVLGQTVSVTPDTIIDDSIIEAFRGAEIPNDLSFANLNPGETLGVLLAGLTVQVSGFPSQNGLEATRIEDVDAVGGTTGGPITDDEIKGFVSNLGAGQFEINGLTVLFDSTDLDSEDFASVALAEGQYVEVHGTAAGTTMNATRIELEDNLFDDDFNEGEIEVEGVIKKITATSGTAGIITINGIDIEVDDISQFSEGLRVEIKGVLQSDGSIQITRLKDEAEDTVRTEDLVVSVDADSFITRLGLDIAPTGRSRLEDDTIPNDDNLSISDFLGNANGERIEARGFPLTGATAWTRLEIEDSNDQDCRLRGPVETGSITGTVSFMIEGVIIDVASTSDNNFEDASGISIGRQAFFAQLADGDIVQATSDQAGVGCNIGELTAREVEFEPADDVLFSGGGNGINDNELTGTVSNITADSFEIAGETVTVTGGTIIDDSIIEDFRGVELINDLPFGDLPETLSQLLVNGRAYQVQVSRSNGVVATSIEDL